MIRGRLLAAALVLATSPVYAMQITTPNRAVNGAVIPVHIKLGSPLRAGQSLEVRVNILKAAEVKLIRGTITSFDLRVRSSRNKAKIECIVRDGGTVTERATRVVPVTAPARFGKSSKNIDRIRKKNRNGTLSVLVSSRDGFTGNLYLNGQDFQAEIFSGIGLSKNPVIKVTGSVSGNVTVATNGFAPSTSGSSHRAQSGNDRTSGSSDTAEALNQIANTLNQMANHQQQLKDAQRRQDAERRQERERQAREAERQRMEAIQARNEQERRRQEQLAKERARSNTTVGNRAPVRGTVINPRPNDSYQPKPRAKPARQVNSNTPGVPATQCVKIITGPNGRGRTFQNTCGFPIEIAWCYVNADCSKGSWGYSNTWTIGAGRTYPATSFESKLYRFTLHYAACKGANVFVEETGPNSFYCK